MRKLIRLIILYGGPPLLSGIVALAASRLPVWDAFLLGALLCSFGMVVAGFIRHYEEAH